MPSSKRLTLPFGMPSRKTVSGTLTGVAAASCALLLTAPSTTAAPTTRPAAGATVSAADGERAPGTGTATNPRHSSDGVAGTVAEEVPAGRQFLRRRDEVTWDMAPGINYRAWDQVDARGTARIHLVTVDLANPANSFDLISTGKVASGTSVSWMTKKAGAIAGVNGDFFDISDTGAPLGVGKARKGGLRHAPAEGWNSAFWVDGSGAPHVGQLPFTGSFKGKHPSIRFTNFNSPVVARGGIGVYTPLWGRTKGPSVTDGQKRVRTVNIRGGRVVSNKYGVTQGKKIKGQLLIGRGQGASLLKKLDRGERLKLRWRLAAKAKMAVGGDRPLLVDGTRVVINDRLLHPRTAVGIDADGGKVLLVTVDGRSATSRGFTMVELADLMTALGAENALNLDGGGSSTMVGHTLAGELSVLNVPSDGTERRVPNGLGVFSDPVS